MSSFRWQTWVPRLLLACVVLLAARYAAGLVMRSLAVRSLERSIGGEAEVAHARVSFVGRQVVLGDVRVAHPVEPRTNLFAAKWCELNFETKPVLYKQAVVASGAAGGLRFGTPREAGDAIAHREPSPMGRSLRWFNDEYPDRAQDWMEHLDRRFDPELIKRSHAIHRTAEVCERVPQQSAQVMERAQALTKRVEQATEELEAAMANPLRNVQDRERAAEEIAALRRELKELTSEFERLPKLVEEERRAIDAVLGQDEEWLRGELQVPAVDADALTAYLLREQVRRPVDEIVGWLRLARVLVPVAPADTKASDRRGEDILFAGCERAAGLLVRSMALQGTARIGGQPVDVCGTLCHYASVPALRRKPMRLRLTSTGSPGLELRATIDRSRAIPHDEVIVDGREVTVPKSSLGESHRLRLHVGPSVGSLAVRVRVDGERLTGEIQLVQRQVEIVPSLGGDLKDVPLAKELTEALVDVHTLATRVSLSGTLDEPKCAFWSNLGAEVAQSLDRAVPRAAEAQARAMRAEIQRQVDERLAELERRLADDRAEWRPLLSQVSGELEKLCAEQKVKGRITPEQVGRQLPANSLFR